MRGLRKRRSSCWPLRGSCGPKIDKKTPRKNQRPVVGALASFLVAQISPEI
jgi:hypothetical protein